MRRIALEEHFVLAGDEHVDRWTALAPMIPKQVAESVLPTLRDVGAIRLDAMDEAGIDLMVLSNTGSVQGDLDASAALRLAREANDFLAETVRGRPDRYAGFATVPLQDPEAGADELERSVADLGLRGTMLFGQTHGRYLDDRSYDPFWERVGGLGVPVYLHAADPQVMPRSYVGAPVLEGSVWSWAAETSTHVLRMILGGVFQRHPKVQVVLGHMGEVLPYLLWRLDRRVAATLGDDAPKPSATFLNHFSVTSAGVFSDTPLRAALEALGDDRVMFSVDFPFESATDGSSWLDGAAIDDAVKEKISHANAERLLVLPTT